MAFSTKLFASDLRRQVIVTTGVIIVAVVAAVILRPHVASSSAEWSVLAASGKAEWRATAGNGDWAKLTLDSRVPDGAELRTGGTGTAVVAKGLDRIELRANTSLVVAARQSTFGKMEID